jgi:type VI protein secretion system component Hcp
VSVRFHSHQEHDMSENERLERALDPDTCVLREDELQAVSGGRASFQDLHFVHVLDKASPVLMKDA